MFSKHLYQPNKEIVSNPIQYVFAFYATFHCEPPNMNSSSTKVFFQSLLKEVLWIVADAMVLALLHKEQVGTSGYQDAFRA